MKPQLALLATCSAVLLIAGIATFRSQQAPASATQKDISNKISALELPAVGAVDHRFYTPSPWQAAQIPQATRFDPPLGSEHAALIYNAQKFWEMNPKRGGHHTGDDLNGIGGMNSDLGDPIYSTADGLVLYAAEPSHGWGKVIVIAHRTLEGQPLHSMYAHLDRINVVPGQLVGRSEKIGTVGTGNNNYPAHLHFEIRMSDSVDLGAGYAMYPFNRLDPEATVSSLRGKSADLLTASPLAAVRKGE